MINVVKSQPAPASLATRTSWRGEDVLLRLREDFFNKCYICEDEGITTINVEHFVPHANNPDLMYSWENLFFACGHCNNIKLALPQYNGILNCTNRDHRTTDWIRYGYDDSNFERLIVLIDEIVTQNGVQPTVQLLRDIYNSTNTIIKKMESENLRRRLQKELALFNNELSNYFLNGNLTENDKHTVAQRIIEHLQKNSAFSAFKIWIIRSKERYMADFGQHIPV